MPKMPALQSQAFWQPPTHTHTKRHPRAASQRNFSRLFTTKQSNSDNPITISSDNDSSDELEEMNGDGDIYANYGDSSTSRDLLTSASGLGTSRSALPAISIVAYSPDESVPTTKTTMAALDWKHSQSLSSGRSESEPVITCYSTITPTQGLTPHQLQHHPRLATHYTQRRHSGDFGGTVAGAQKDNADTEESDYPIDPLLEDISLDIAASSNDAVSADTIPHAASNVDAEVVQALIPLAESTHASTGSAPQHRFAALPSPTRSPSVDADKDRPRVSATFKEWLLDNTVLKRTVIDGKAVIQLQFEWPLHTKHCREAATSHEAKRRRTSGSTAGRDIHISNRRVKLSSEEDELLRRLKDDSGDFSWSEIHKRFTATYPGRSRGALQVRYCTKLKAR